MKSALEHDHEIAVNAARKRERREALDRIKCLSLALVPELNIELIEILNRLSSQPLGSSEQSGPFNITVYDRDPQKNLDEHNQVTSANGRSRMFIKGATIVRTGTKECRIDGRGSERCITVSYSKGGWRVLNLHGFVEPSGRSASPAIGGAQPLRER